MKKIVTFIIIFVAISSCKKKETTPTTPILLNCQIEYLFFRDDIMMRSNASIVIPPSDSKTTKCEYQYVDSKMITSIGGFVVVPTGSNFSNLLFSEDAYDSISQIGNTIYVSTKYKTNNGIVEDSNNPIIFSIDSDEKLIKITKKDVFWPGDYDLNYTYSTNQITETDNNGKICRVFHFENNNLVKVVSEIYDMQGVIFSKKEILFQEFDDKPNPFKNKYFARGAFFRAFSENNFKSHTTNEYIKSSDGSLVLFSKYWFTMPIIYNSDGYPLFGDYK